MSRGIGRGYRPLLVRCHAGHESYVVSGAGTSGRRWCRECASIAARARYELIRDAARVAGLTIADYRKEYGQTLAVAVAVLEGRDPLAP